MRDPRFPVPPFEEQGKISFIFETDKTLHLEFDAHKVEVGLSSLPARGAKKLSGTH